MYERILAELLDDVVTRRVDTGDRLPTTEDIAARHACSRSAAREAIRALEERRIVEVQAGQGQVILAPDRWKVLDRTVAKATLLRHEDRQLVRQAMEFLRHVEPRATMIAARRLEGGDVDMLIRELDRMRTLSGGGNGTPDYGDRFADAEAEFHRTLLLLARNRFMADALAELYPVIARARRRRAGDRDPLAIALHEQIVNALASRDPAGAAAADEEYCRHLASWLGV